MDSKHTFAKNIKADIFFPALASLLLISAVFISSCRSQTVDPTPTSAVYPSPTQVKLTPTPSQTPTPAVLFPDPPFLTWVDPYIPQHLRESIFQFDFLTSASDPSSAQLTLSLDTGQPAGSWNYLAVAPFYSHRDGVRSSALSACWTSTSPDGLSFKQILVTEQTKASLDLIWGSGHGSCVQTVTLDELRDQLWVEKDAIAIIPFEKIQPDYKVLSIDNADPLALDFDPGLYPLVLDFRFQVAAGLDIDLGEDRLVSNFDPSKLSSIALTGVTALVRDTANIMENKGITYPAAAIQDILSSADITHINNEVPFADDCPRPEAYQVSLRFCSDDRYIQLLEAVGTDIVELSGDHFGDWGPEAMLHTLELYQQKGWAIYGGGENLTEGLAPVFISHNGNRFAFIGCNAKGFERYATATDENPGAAQCDFRWMIAEISRLASKGYIVIATMQHEEIDGFASIALQQYDFRRLAEAGASIVSGSQAHHPQAFEYTGNSFIHYGLGNLFFDQWHLAQVNPKDHINKDKSFIDLHFFYNGTYIGTRFIPLQFIDNAQPRPMTAEEKQAFLDEVYIYSLWEGEKVYKYPAGIMLDRMEP